MNFNHIPRIKEVAFDHLDSSCYDNEKLIHNKQINEIYNNYGARCYFYIVDYNTERDQIFGEDTDRHILRKFPVQASFTIPEEEDIVSLFGIEEMDNFEMFIAKVQFKVASTLEYDDEFGESKGTFPEYVPNEGDLIRPNYSSQIYEVLHVHDTEDQFLQTQYVWKLIVRKYKDLHFTVEPSMSASLSGIAQDVDQGDLFDIGRFIDNIKEPVLLSGTENGIDYEIVDTSAVATSSYVTSSEGEATLSPRINNENDPFGGW